MCFFFAIEGFFWRAVRTVPVDFVLDLLVLELLETFCARAFDLMKGIQTQSKGEVGS